MRLDQEALLRGEVKESPFLDEKHLLVDGQPLPLPTQAFMLYAVLCVRDSKVADVLYFADGHKYTPLIVLEHATVEIAGWADTIHTRLEELRLAIRSIGGSLGVFVDGLDSETEKDGLLIHRVPRRFQNFTYLLCSSDSHITTGKVKVCDFIYNQMLQPNHPLTVQMQRDMITLVDVDTVTAFKAFMIGILLSKEGV